MFLPVKPFPHLSIRQQPQEYIRQYNREAQKRRRAKSATSETVKKLAERYACINRSDMLIADEKARPFVEANDEYNNSYFKLCGFLQDFTGLFGTASDRYDRL